MAKGFYPRIKDLMPVLMKDFYDRLFSDIMIGFFFAPFDKQELIDKQIGFMTVMFGGPNSYKGLSLRKVHLPLNIFEGQFNRRHQILKETLEDHKVDSDIREDWLRLDLSLKDKILKSESCHD
ncbi:MAG: group 1 truncated hemoglobin [Planctomycetota bacterium]|nr:group 1 truncated hemoglobin [Planctomycetota bacterium]